MKKIISIIIVSILCFSQTYAENKTVTIPNKWKFEIMEYCQSRSNIYLSLKQNNKLYFSEFDKKTKKYDNLIQTWIKFDFKNSDRIYFCPKSEDAKNLNVLTAYFNFLSKKDYDNAYALTSKKQVPEEFVKYLNNLSSAYITSDVTIIGRYTYQFNVSFDFWGKITKWLMIAKIASKKIEIVSFK